MIDADAGVALGARVTFPSATVDLFGVGVVRVTNDQRAPAVSYREGHDDPRHSAVGSFRQRCHPPALGHDFQQISDCDEVMAFWQSREERVSDGLEDRMVRDFEGGG